jgi:flavin reductase
MALDVQTFKAAMAQFATGVTVVATQFEGQRYGITANAFCSVSLDPPLVLICVDKRLTTHTAITESGIFSISILSLYQMEWGDRFAGRYPNVLDRFEGIEVHTAVTGSPILPECLAWVDCELRHTYDGGDHTIFVGEVVASAAPGGAPPLLYHDRHWTQLAEEGPDAGSTWPSDRKRV